MRDLFGMDKGDYGKGWPVFKRDSVRGVIWVEGKLAMVYASEVDLYKFPGGGIEAGETHEETLIREVFEEVGLCVRPETIVPYGRVMLRGKKAEENRIFEQENFYYRCEVDERRLEARLEAGEARLGFVLRFVTPEEACIANERQADCRWQWVKREARVLRLLMDEGPQSE